MNGTALELDINQVTRDEIVVRYGTLVKRIAHHLAGRLPASVQCEDLIQSGMIGLLEAARNYKDDKGATFETYAGIRIRGAMLDEIRRGDWVPRSVHRNTRKVAESIRKVEHETGRDARDFEVAESMGINLEEYHQMLQDTASGRVMGYEDLGVSEEMISEGLGSTIPEPFDGLQEDNFRQYLAKSIAALPERERLIMALYYDEELNLREIGDVLGVTESRVCQIHSQAVIRLQARMKDWRN